MVHRCVVFSHLVLLVQSCTYVEVAVPDNDSVNKTKFVIGRTFEFANLLQHFDHRIHVTPRGEHGGRFGYVSMDFHLALPGVSPIWITNEGMNEASLTVSAQSLHETKYEGIKPVAGDMLAVQLPNALLRNCANVQEALQWLGKHRMVGPSGLFGAHYALADASGRSVVVEYLEGRRVVYENEPRVMTNDPPLDWHWRNLNTYVNVNPDFPHQNDFLAVDTSVGTVPHTAGHGWNLAGLPGDSSPPSRFVQMFYLRGYAMRFEPPKAVDDAIALISGLLNRVFIPNGVAAKDPKALGDNADYTQWAMIKIPTEQRILIRGYTNLRWRQIDLKRLDFTKRMTWAVEDGTLGIEDITSKGAVTENDLI